MKQVVQIIGGRFRGKKLPVLTLDGLRPTPNRVRETLFNWLMHDIHGARCLDAFAGSGALGFEAYSRGASQVILLEHHPQAYAQLSKLASDLSSSTNTSSSQLMIKHVDAHLFLKNTTEQFNLIFLDPPFSKDDLLPCIKLLERPGLLAKGGLVYIESAKAIDLPAWETLKLKRAGQVVYGLYTLRSKDTKSYAE